MLSRQNRNMDLIPGKIRKRGCSSPASSSSSILHNYRFKRAIAVGKRGGSTAPVPAWKLLHSRSPASALRTIESPEYPPSQRGCKTKQAPMSARKLAATLWEMNGIPSPRVKDGLDCRSLKKEVRAREKISRSVHSGSLPPHLSDPSHSPVSERTDRSGTVSLRRRTPSISNRPKLINHHMGALDSASNASLMEIESRSAAQAPTSSMIGVKTRLKDVSNALTTSKELLKIINGMWGHGDRPSSMSLIAALHAELERARLQVNQLIQEHRSDQHEINYLMKCFVEEKAAWKSKEQEVVDAAIEAVAGELEVERKLRRRFESVNKKLGRELSETKESLVKVVKDLESEKRAREIIEQVCDELAKDANEDKAEIEGRERDSAEVCEEPQYQTEENNATVDKIWDQLGFFLGNKNIKEKGRGSIQLSEDEIAGYLRRTNFGFHRNEIYEDTGEVDNGMESEEGLAESDLHSIELNVDNDKNSCKWNYNAVGGLDPQRYSVEEVVKGKKYTFSNTMRSSSSLQRSISDGLDLELPSERVQRLGDGIDWERLTELEKPEGKGYGDQMQGYKSMKGPREQILSGSRLAPSRAQASPTRDLWPSRNPTHVPQRTDMLQGNGLRLRGMETKGEGLNTRRSKR